MGIVISNMRILSNSVDHTIKIGRRLAARLKKGDIVCLTGPLGSGKTVLAKGIAGSLGIKQGAVISPTFVLIREYKGRNIPLYHFDLYRLDSPQDILALGYEEYLYDEGITVIEWPERLSYLMPEEYLMVKLSMPSLNRRYLQFSAQGNRYKGLLRQIYEDIRN
ncbi:MAG: tRNA (adenosine(37)-N6)-threonylcarbamoyltransferase complex ATPase subunit type 1 TsaE [Candidatus Omnitrophota bacterium]